MTTPAGDPLGGRSAPATVLPTFCFVLLVSGTGIAGQELPHPRQMDLPGVEVERPDPGAHQIGLENGLTAYVAEDRTVPLVTLTAFVRAGTAHEPAGAVAALARAFGSGPADLEPGAFSGALREMAAEYRVDVGPERLELVLDVPAEDVEAAADLLARTLRAPRIGADDASAVEGPPAGSFDESLDDAFRLFRAHLYGDHPYGPAGAREVEGTLSASAVQEAHGRLVNPGSVVLSVGGAVDPDAARRIVRERFGDWTADAAGPTGSPPPLEPPADRRVHLYPAPEALQGWIVIGHELPPVAEEDAAALEVMNYILGGGHFDTRLFRATRDRRGLTNDASGFPEALVDGPGTYTFRTYGRPAAVKLLVELTFREIERIRSERVSEEELLVARGALSDGVFADRYRDGWATARSLAEERAMWRHHRRSASYRERIERVTADDVLEAARTYLHPERMQVIVIGPLDRIRSAPPMEDERSLDGWGPVRVHAAPAESR